jgi:hypothetical protein
MMDAPGIGNQTMNIKFARDWMGKDAVGMQITTGYNYKLEVLEVFIPVWWKRWLGKTVWFLYSEELRMSMPYYHCKVLNEPKPTL